MKIVQAIILYSMISVAVLLSFWNISRVASEGYECSYDKYNCDDFPTQQQAQELYNSCMGDIHRLDNDNDHIACENNK